MDILLVNFFFFLLFFSLKMVKGNEKWNCRNMKETLVTCKTQKNARSPEMGQKRRFVIHIERKDFGEPRVCGWYIDLCVPNTKQRVQHVFEDV